MSDDRGSSWLPPLDRTGLPALPVWAIAPAPGNTDNVVVALGYEKDLGTGSNHFDAGPRLFHKTDVRAPGPWTPVHGTAPGLLPLGPMFAILRHPAAPDAVWFASGDLGVFRTG